MTGKDDFVFNYSNSDEVNMQNLGEQLKQMRLNKNMTQRQLSELSGLSRSAISDLENRGAGTVNTFVRVLRALEKLEILTHFITEAPVSPIQIAKLKGKMRKRASGVNREKDEEGGAEW